jgi:acyl-CoA thioesterase
MLPNQIVNEMLSEDSFSNWLGIELLKVELSYCKLKMLTRTEMLNGFGILHGGISYALADSALAFAANTEGRHSVSIETSISHHVMVRENETLFAEAAPIVKQSKFSNYQVLVTNSENQIVASFKGTVYHSSESWK